MAGVTAWEDNLDGWFEYNVKFAQETLVERGNVGHMLTMHTRLGDVIPVSAVWTSDDEKERVLALARLLCLAFDVVAVGWMGEAWLVDHPSPAEMAVRASASPRRKDCLIVSLESRADSRTRVAIREIVRKDGAGKPLGLRPVELPDGVKAAGSFACLLPDGEVPAEVRNAALEALEKGGFPIPEVVDPRKPPSRH